MQIKGRQQLNSLIKNSVKIKISKISKALNLLNSEVPEQGSEIFKIKKVINYKAQLIEKINKKTKFFFTKRLQKPHTNKNVILILKNKKIKYYTY